MDTLQHVFLLICIITFKRSTPRARTSFISSNKKPAFIAVCTFIWNNHIITIYTINVFNWLFIQMVLSIGAAPITFAMSMQRSTDELRELESNSLYLPMKFIATLLASISIGTCWW